MTMHTFTSIAMIDVLQGDILNIEPSIPLPGPWGGGVTWILRSEFNEQTKESVLTL